MNYPQCISRTYGTSGRVYPSFTVHLQCTQCFLKVEDHALKPFLIVQPRCSLLSVVIDSSRGVAHYQYSLGFLIFARCGEDDSSRGVARRLRDLRESSNRRRVAWKTIAWGVALQLIIGLIIFRLPVSHRILLVAERRVLVCSTRRRAVPCFCLDHSRQVPASQAQSASFSSFRFFRS
jgi:hypothetical protein